MKDSLSKQEIAEVRSRGKKFDCGFFTGYFNKAENTGIAIIASARLGSSVQRNRIKRRLRQALRLELKEKERENKQRTKVILYAKKAVIKAKIDSLMFVIKTALGII